MNAGKTVIAVIFAVSLISLGGCSIMQSSKVSADSTVEGFKHVALASVSDAVDQVVGQRGFMNYDMRPIVGKGFVGRARTAVFRPADKLPQGTELTLKDGTEMIDNAQEGEVGIIIVEDGLNIAGIGGLMSTAAKSRNLAGMVIDGGVRDIEEIKRLGLPVFGRSITPATAVNRYASIGKDITVQCAGVTVNPGDIIVAGTDGIVCVPKEKAEEVLKKAQEIDATETKMVPYIKKYKSIQKAVEEFNRI
ncbi:MAG: RraA family protein [Sedimentisphaerales bacterium]|nr:RraA family protein [Sedimentisphaerales bacterium]